MTQRPSQESLGPAQRSHAVCAACMCIHMISRGARMLSAVCLLLAQRPHALARHAGPVRQSWHQLSHDCSWMCT